MPQISGIFKLIHENGVPLEEMFKVFNMGVGFIVVVDEKDKENALETLNKYYSSFEIGKVTKDKGIIVDNYRVRL